MNDRRKSRLAQLATGLALVSSAALADDAPSTEPREVNSPNPAYQKKKPAPPKAPSPVTVNSPPPGPTAPVRVNSPPEVAPEPRPAAVDAGVPSAAPPVRLNSPGTSPGKK